MECPRPNLNQVSFHNYSECRESRLQGVQSSERRGQEKPWVCPLALSSCHSDAPKTTEFQLEVIYAKGKFALGQKNSAPVERTAGRRRPPRTRSSRGHPVRCHSPTLQLRSRDGEGRGISRGLGRVADQNGAAA